MAGHEHSEPLGVIPGRPPGVGGAGGEGVPQTCESGANITGDAPPASSGDARGGSAEGGEGPAQWFWHEVDMSDSLMGLAVRYGVSQNDIKVSNALQLGDAIHYKKRLRIPCKDAPRSVIGDLGRAATRDAAALKLQSALPHRRTLSGDIEMISGSMSLDPRLRSRPHALDGLTARLRAVYSDEPGTEHRVPRPLQMNRDVLPSTSSADRLLPDEAVSGSALLSGRTAPRMRTTRSDGVGGDRASSSGSAGGWSAAEQRPKSDLPSSSAFGMPGHVSRRKERKGAPSYERIKGGE